VCGLPATVSDCVAVADCPCGRLRLARLTPQDRETLGQRLRDLRATQTEAWITTRDAPVMGALVIRTVRPDSPR